jgi:hypothetical protein
MAAAGDDYKNEMIEQENNTLGGAAAGASGGSDNNDEIKVVFESNDECPICLEDFEEENLKYLTCGCGTNTCIECAKECLLNSTKDPHCHACKRGWDRAFQYKHFGTKWVNKTYKNYRKTLLLDREKARMPETMPFVTVTEKLEEYEQRIREVNNSLRETRDKIFDLEYLRRELYQKKHIIKNGGIVTDKGSDERGRFIKACPNDDCRGFLSSAYKCDLCKIFVCPTCFEIKGFSKNEPHTCDENNIKAAMLIKKETKPCPKCAVPIFKIHGCSQMWCTQCHVAFSWNTGRIEHGVVHNPHFYEWARENGRDTLNPGTIVCGGLVDYYVLSRTIRSIYVLRQSEEIYNLIFVIHRGARHFNYILDGLRNDMNGNQDNKDIRIRYLRNEIDEKHLAKIVTQRDNIREKKLAMLQIMELMNTVLIENFTDLRNNIENLSKEVLDIELKKERINDCINAFFTNISNTRKYVNRELMKVSENYKMKVYYVPYNFDLHNVMNSAYELMLINQIEETKDEKTTKDIFNKLIGKDRKKFAENLEKYLESLEK